VGTTVVVTEGPRIDLVDLGGAGLPETFSLDRDLLRAAERLIELRPADLPPGLVEAVIHLSPTTRVVAGDASLGRALSVRSGRSVPSASTDELRSARAIVWRGPPRDDRPFALALARITLERALRSPEEVLISLAREEERLERALGREERAAAAFLPVAGTPLAEYRLAWDAMRETLRAHHAGLEERLEHGARNLAPNLSAVLGEKVAARLVAAAGGLPPLGRMSAARLQLLGTRRRPSPERGPRFGIIYRAVRMDEVPVARRGAYARSLAALGVIAARADATTGRSLATVLVGRRDRRVEALRRRKR
jgi:snoRNA binding domain, fibrillarin